MKKEIPILFSTPMVQAILQGRKTMTRRVCRDNRLEVEGFYYVQNNPTYPEVWAGKKSEPYTGWVVKYNNLALHLPRKCPYGKAGDVLWVRETFYAFGKWVKNGITKTGKQKYKFIDCTKKNMLPYYYPDNIEKNVYHKGISTEKNGEIRWYKRPSLFMVKDACRIWLEITHMRVERLHDISEDDAMAEGVELVDYNCFRNYLVESDWQYDGKNQKGYHMIEDPKGSFASLWHKINGEESWNTNPWVWVIEFKVLSTTGKPQIKELAHAH